MSHSFANNISVLRRWQAHGGGVLPSDWEKFERSNILAAVELKERDPELVSLLDGSADAGLVADAISGKLSSTPPNFEAMQQKNIELGVHLALPDAVALAHLFGHDIGR